MREKRIEVFHTAEEIASCNTCMVRNFESKFADKNERVEDLYEVRIDRTYMMLCKKCLLELIVECSKALLKGEENDNEK